VGSKATVAAAGSSMTWMSSMGEMVSLTTNLVKIPFGAAFGIPSTSHWTGACEPPMRQDGSNRWSRDVRLYLWLAFGITWGAGGLALLLGAFRSEVPGQPLHPLHYVAAFGPSIAGVSMAAVTGRWAGVRQLFARAIPSRAGVPWYIVVLAGFPAANFAATWLIGSDALARLPSWDRLLWLVPLTLVLDTGPLGEEFGWRGFALPKFLDRWSPMSAALILGAIWFAWHLPTFFISTLSQSKLSIPLFFVNSVSLSIVMTWLYLRTAGDLFAMILIHVMANYCGAIGIPFIAEVSAEVVMAALIVVGGGLRPPNSA
jgi:membrane protease YdiL (CAAX protease family)